MHLTSENPELRNALTVIAHRLANSSEHLLIHGRTGTGKTVLAQWIHELGGQGRPLVTVNCPAALDARWEAAAGGTLLLEEISLLSEADQERLRGVLAAGAGTRIISTTNQGLPLSGVRPDLYYRLTTLTLRMPDLRERMEDVPNLVREILARLSSHQLAVANEAKAALLSYPWPGNIRELESCLKRAVMHLGKERTIGVKHLPPEVCRGLDDKPDVELYRRFQEAAERTLLVWVLADCTSKTQAAEALGMSRANLYKRLNALGLR